MAKSQEQDPQVSAARRGALVCRETVGWVSVSCGRSGRPRVPDCQRCAWRLPPRSLEVTTVYHPCLVRPCWSVSAPAAGHSRALDLGRVDDEGVRAEQARGEEAELLQRGQAGEEEDAAPGACVEAAEEGGHSTARGAPVRLVRVQCGSRAYRGHACDVAGTLSSHIA